MNDKKKYILALDCGTTNFRAAVFDADGCRICERQEPLRYTVRVPARVEFEGEVAWRTCVRLIREAAAQARVTAADTCQIIITAQANTFCAFDADGQALMPFMSFLDQRAAQEAALLTRRLEKDFHQHSSWPRSQPGHLAAMLLWLRLRRPQITNKIASIVTLPGYIAQRLGAPNCMDPNMASLTGLYSLKTNSWWPAMLKLCGVSEQQLPALTDPGKQIAAANCRDFLPIERASVTFAGHDQTAMAYGNFCSQKTMLIVLGSGSLIYHIPGARRASGPFSAEGCWGLYPGGGFYESLLSKQGWAALEWARVRLLLGRDILVFTQLARRGLALRKTQSAERSEAFFYPAAINTERAWHGNDNIKIEERALAAFEGVAFALKYLIREELGIGPRMPEVRFMGSGSNNSFWLQLLANILGARVAPSDRDALDGAASMLLTKKAAASAKRREKINWFEPRNVGGYTARYERWKQKLPSILAFSDKDACP